MTNFRNISLSSVKLGIKIAELRNKYQYKELVEYLRGTISETYHLYLLKPLYDEYGYKEVNELILQLEEPGLKENK